jgi:predicted phosphodiesterase
MRILFYGDIHHGSSFRYGRDIDGVNSRLRASLRVEEEIYKAAREEKVELIVFLGDLVELSSRAHINDVVRRYILGMPDIPRIFVVGNHDLFYKELSFFGNVNDIFRELGWQVIDDANVMEFSGVRIGFAGWKAVDSDLVGLIDKADVSIWFLHKEIKGGFLRKNFIAESGILLEGNRDSGAWVVTGHHHVPGVDEQRRILFAGSVHRVDLNDCDGLERGYYLWDSVEPDAFTFVRLENIPQLDLIELRLGDDFEVERFLREVLVPRKGNCVILRVAARKFLQNRTDIMVESGLENLTIQPVVLQADTGKDKALQVIGAATSQDDRLWGFVNLSKTELDKERLFRTGKEILASCSE